MIDKFKCKFDNLIGKPYGFHYEIKEQQLNLERIQTQYIQGIFIYLTKLQRRKLWNKKQ